METLEEIELCFPQLLNTSCKKPKRSHFEVIMSYIILSSITVLSTTLNLLVIITISHFNSTPPPTSSFSLWLFQISLWASLWAFFQIMFIDGCWYLGYTMCIVYLCLGCFITASSVGNMVLICADRYVAICNPLHYSTKVTQKRVQVCVSLCWIGSVIFQSLVLKNNFENTGSSVSCTGECVAPGNYITQLADMVLSFIGPVIVIIVLYMRVFVVAVSQARAMRSHTVAVTLQGSVKVNVKKSELKAARTLGVVVVVFLMCVCPYYIVVFTTRDALLDGSSTFMICMLYLSASINPLIYVFVYSWFRKCLKLIVTLEILRPDSCEANIL